LNESCGKLGGQEERPNGLAYLDNRPLLLWNRHPTSVEMVQGEQHARPTQEGRRRKRNRKSLALWNVVRCWQRGLSLMFGRPGAWESLKLESVRDAGTGDEALCLCSTPDAGLRFEVCIPGTAKTTPDLQQKVREWFHHNGPLPASGTTTRIPGTHFTSH
jgi:hypothetical protein